MISTATSLISTPKKSRNNRPTRRTTRYCSRSSHRAACWRPKPQTGTTRPWTRASAAWEANHQGQRPPDAPADGNNRKRPPATLTRLHGAGANRQQAILPVAQHNAYARLDAFGRALEGQDQVRPLHRWDGGARLGRR